jgi:uncharacterized coiled-coil protein SlyX
MSGDNKRLELIESALMHLQQDVEQINSSLSVHFERLQAIDQRFRGLERELEIMQEPEEARDPKLEKPPHY